MVGWGIGGSHRLNPLCVGLVLAVALWSPSDTAAGAAFHTGPGGNCEGCHGATIRSNGEPDGGTIPATGMLKGSDASSTCLMCHETPVNGPTEQHHVATSGEAMGPGVPPRQLTPGGDFGWLKKQYRWTDHEDGGPGVEETSPGDRHGHNVVAADFGYGRDRTHANAPGGVYPSGGLSCISCHDPHAASSAGAEAASYRMLGGSGYQPKHVPSLPMFTEDSPAAAAPRVYNRAESATSTRVAYGSGMSEWCRNCHQSVHGSSAGHPVGSDAKMGAAILARYNSYVGSGNLGGSSAAAYTSLVPYEIGTDDPAVLRAVAAGANGAATGAGLPNVMCLTCHRAHASAWDSMTRWNTRALFIVKEGRYPGIDNADAIESAQGRTSVETAKGYYDRLPSAFAWYQRSLCNKCHAKD